MNWSLPALLLTIMVLAPDARAQNPAGEALPPLPAYIRSAGLLRAGVRCDQPPYGYRDAQGKFAGVEVDMARQMAEWAFGPGKIELSCVTADNRIPQLNAKRVDLLIATLGITPERARVIDFSTSYRWGGSDVLVKQDSPVRKLDDVEGHTVIMLRGTTQSAWFDQNMPNLKTLRLGTISDALQALQQDRGDALAADATTLVVIAGANKSLRMVGEPFAVSDTAVGVRKNEAEWLEWVNAALARMKAEKMYGPWLVKWVPPETRQFYSDSFEKPRPDAR